MKAPEPGGAHQERQGEHLSCPSEAEKEAAMSLVEDMFKGGNVGTGIVAVIGAAIVAPVVLPVVRTLAKTVIKAGLVAYDQGRVMVDDMREGSSSLVEEARQELAEQRSAGESDEASPRRRRKAVSAEAPGEPAAVGSTG